MKYLLTFTLLINFFSAYSQHGMIVCSVVVTDSLDNDLIHVLLSKETKQVYSKYQLIGKDFIIDSLEAGHYSLRISKWGRSERSFKYIDLKAGEVSDVVILYPDSCRYDYPKGFKPVCPKGNKDPIIPVIYGFPSPKEMRKAEKGKIYLGGCVTTGCDPGYYCKIHKEMF